MPANEHTSMCKAYPAYEIEHLETIFYSVNIFVNIKPN
jgi:hypothetical protein